MKPWWQARGRSSLSKARGIGRGDAAPSQPAERPRYFLAREIALVLAVKCLALSVIWWAWFAHPESHAVDAARMSGWLYDAAAPATQPEGSASNAQR